MNILATAALLLTPLLFATAADSPPTEERNCYYGGKHYRWEIHLKQLERTPNWEPAKQPNPPLSAAKALAKAQAFIRSILPDEHAKWQLRCLHLSNQRTWGRWLWQVSYDGPSHDNSGVPPTMECYILLDGTVLQPTIIDQ
jgi:hypothetical protein